MRGVNEKIVEMGIQSPISDEFLADVGRLAITFAALDQILLASTPLFRRKAPNRRLTLGSRIRDDLNPLLKYIEVRGASQDLLELGRSFVTKLAGINNRRNLVFHGLAVEMQGSLGVTFFNEMEGATLERADIQRLTLDIEKALNEWIKLLPKIRKCVPLDTSLWNPN